MKTPAQVAAGRSKAEPPGNELTVSGLAAWLLGANTATAAALGAAIVILLGMPLAAALSIWVDEAFTLHTTGAGPLQAWAQAVAFEAQPPLFFVLEAAWRTFNEASIAFARLPSVLFAAAAVALIVYAGHRIAPRVPPLAVALVTALNPLVIWAAVEMRVYALVLLIGACLTWTFYEGFILPRPSRGARIWYVIVAIVGLYTQYYVGFLLAAQAITLLAVRRGAIRGFAVCVGIVAVAFGPFLRVAMTHAQASGEFVLHVTPLRAFREVVDAVLIVVFPHDISWAGATKTAGFILAAALLTWLFGFGRPAVPRDPVRAVVMQWLICLGIFGLLFSVTGAPLAPLKYLIVVAPSSLLVAFLFVSSLKRVPALGARVSAVVYGIFAITALLTQYRPPFEKPGEWRRVAATLSAGDKTIPVAVFPAELAQPLSWYLPGPMLPIPSPMPFSLDYVHKMTLTNESEVARVLDPVLARSEQLWLVTTGDCSKPTIKGYYDYHCRYLEAYLKRRYRVVRSVAFYGSLARLYARLPHSTADVQTTPYNQSGALTIHLAGMPRNPNLRAST